MTSREVSCLMIGTFSGLSMGTSIAAVVTGNWLWVMVSIGLVLVAHDLRYWLKNP